MFTAQMLRKKIKSIFTLHFVQMKLNFVWIWFYRIVRIYQQLHILNRFNQENWVHCKLNYVDEKGFFYEIWLNFHSNWIQSTNLGTLIDRMFKPKIQCNGNLPIFRSSQLILYSNRTLTHSKRSFIYLITQNNLFVCIIRIKWVKLCSSTAFQLIFNCNVFQIFISFNWNDSIIQWQTIWIIEMPKMKMQFPFFFFIKS